MINIVRVFGVVAVGILSLNVASASLVYETTLAFGGAGLGSAPTVLTIHDTGQQGAYERGCQAWTSGGVLLGATACTSTMEAIPGGDESASQSPTRIFANNTQDVGGLPAGSGDFTDITNAGQIRIIFNAAESGSDNSIRLDDLVLKVYDTGGTLLWNSGAFLGTQSQIGGDGLCSGTVNLAYDCFDIVPGGGIGGAGFVYKLDDAQVADLNATVFFNPIHIGPDSLSPLFLNYHVALDAAVSAHSGGQETFFLYAREDLFVIPEPSTWFSLGSGLLLLAAFARKRFQKV